MVAGEASGDFHGGRLLAELKARVPALSAYGLGGDEMARLNFEAVAESRDIAVVGLTEALRVLPRARQIFRLILAEVDRRGTRTAVLIDFAEFNLRLARQLHRRGVRVVYYISPQVWAWRRRRVKAIARTVDRMLVLFPFEVDFYRRHGVQVEHVGHPLIDEVPRLAQVWDLPAGGEGPRVLTLLPGSRRSEVRALLPSMLESAARAAAQLPIEVRLIEAPTVPRELFDQLLAAGRVEVRRIRGGDRFAAIAGSHLTLCAAGTATLEVGLLTTPMLVLYRVSRGTYWLARLLVSVPHASIVNLVLGRGAVPELLQEDGHPERVAAEALRLLRDPAAIAAMRSSLGELRQALGSGGASRNAAAVVAATLEAS